MGIKVVLARDLNEDGIFGTNIAQIDANTGRMEGSVARVEGMGGIDPKSLLLLALCVLVIIVLAYASKDRITAISAGPQAREPIRMERPAVRSPLEGPAAESPLDASAVESPSKASVAESAPAKPRAAESPSALPQAPRPTPSAPRPAAQASVKSQPAVTQTKQRREEGPGIVPNPRGHPDAREADLPGLDAVRHLQGRM